jgi:hypothetical protein
MSERAALPAGDERMCPDKGVPRVSCACRVCQYRRETAARPKQPKPSMVYFVQAESGPIKIGVSVKTLDRLSALQGGSHERLRLMAYIDGGTRELETALHRRFRAHRISGEWFSPAPELLDFIRAHARITARPEGT